MLRIISGNRLVDKDVGLPTFSIEITGEEGARVVLANGAAQFQSCPVL
jgi:hypothetical protein